MELSQKTYIESFSIKGLWGEKDIVWNHINPDVNVLVGINGSGKTTLLNAMNAYYSQDNKELKKQTGELQGNPVSSCVHPITYLRSFDTVSTIDKEGLSFFNYRMKKLDYPEKAEEIQQNIDELFDIVNELFSDTQKRIDTSKGNNSTLIFHQGNQIIHLEQLSAGEKQLLLILLKMFLLEKQPAVFFMDEPEISLHIRWQREIINKLRQLNPLCQLIISTHSPSIFGAGWGDKVIYMEDLMR